MTYLYIFIIGCIAHYFWATIREAQKMHTTTFWQSEFICKEGNVNDKMWSNMSEFVKKNFIDGDKAIIYLEKVNK